MLKEKQKQILKDTLSGVKRITENVKNIPGYVRERTKQFVEERKADRGAGVLAKKLMGPEKGSDVSRFPSYTLIGEKKHAGRTKEITGMIKKGNIGQAKDFIASKRKEFDSLNYDK